MTNRWLLQAALLLCLSTAVLSVINYEQLRLQQSRGSLTCQKLLIQLQRSFCLDHRMDFKIPAEISHPRQMENKDIALVIQEMLQNIFVVFRGNFSSTGWNKTVVESLLGELHEQIDLLKEILEEQPEEESLTSRRATAILHLKSYYWRMQRYLADKGYSSCAWTVVQAEINRNFNNIKKLTKFFRN